MGVIISGGNGPAASDVVTTTEERVPVGRLHLSVEFFYRPVAWGMGVVLLSWIGFSHVDLVTAFIVGFCVGLVHDLALYAFGVITYRDKVEAIELEKRFTVGLEHFSKSEWEKAPPIFLDRLRLVPGHSRSLYFAIRCYENLSEWELMERTCQQYLSLHPRNDEVLGLLRRAQEQMNSSSHLS